jgi:hypothetical protein
VADVEEDLVGLIRWILDNVLENPTTPSLLAQLKIFTTTMGDDMLSNHNHFTYGVRQSTTCAGTKA